MQLYHSMHLMLGSSNLFVNNRIMHASIVEKFNTNRNMQFAMKQTKEEKNQIINLLHLMTLLVQIIQRKMDLMSMKHPFRRHSEDNPMRKRICSNKK